MKMKPVPKQQARADHVQCTEMVLVAHEGGTPERDNESEPRLERRTEQSHVARETDNTLDSKLVAKGPGKNRREEPTLKEIYAIKADKQDAEAAKNGGKGMKQWPLDTGEHSQDDDVDEEMAPLADDVRPGSSQMSQKIKMDEAQQSKQVIMD